MEKSVINYQKPVIKLGELITILDDSTDDDIIIQDSKKEELYRGRIDDFRNPKSDRIVDLNEWCVSKVQFVGIEYLITVDEDE